jgi:CYTH domain-containing protein
MNDNVKEIERRWILRNFPSKSLLTDAQIPRIVGYLCHKYNELRIVSRIKNDKRGYLLSAKTDGGLVRDEWQVEIPEWVYTALFSNAELRTINVTRSFINYRKYLLEIDEYFGRFKGLIKLECEFSSEEEANNFIVPDFLSETVEVTEDSRFNNKFLSLLTDEEIKTLYSEFKIKVTE